MFWGVVARPPISGYKVCSRIDKTPSSPSIIKRKKEVLEYGESIL